MLEKPCKSGTQYTQKLCYKSVTDCIYWPLLGTCNSWNISTFSNKSTPSEEFHETHMYCTTQQHNTYSLITSSHQTTRGYRLMLYTTEGYMITFVCCKSGPVYKLPLSISSVPTCGWRSGWSPLRRIISCHV